MRAVVLPRLGTVAAWRDAARGLAAEGVPAEDVLWSVGAPEPDLFAGGGAPPGPGRALTLGRAAVEAIELALCHSDPERFARAYALILRLSAGRTRWEDRSDPLVQAVLAQGKAVARDIHKMHAFVRFREVEGAGDGGRRRFAAWFEPEHFITERAAPFFANRFGDMDWIIATPALTAAFTGGVLEVFETTARPPAVEDRTEELWRVYYASIFNAARLMPKAMRAEMPKKYWHNLPEAELIPGLIRGAGARVAAMVAREPVPPPARRTAALKAMAAPADNAAPPGSLAALAREAARCTRCALCGPATQVVPGEGPPDARLMIVAEQPGDREDLMGRPLVGPAGQLFDAEAGAAGLERGRAYITNAVKHFKFTPRGKRRIHMRPDATEIEACRWWLDQERALIRPRLILAMGATALAALTGSGEGILKRRGGTETLPDGTPLLVTVHPAYILRIPDPAQQAAMRALFREDLATAARSAG